MIMRGDGRSDVETGARRAACAAALAALVALAAAPTAAQSGRDDSLISPGAGKMNCRDLNLGEIRVQIAGGQDADVRKYPFIVEVRNARGRCGGSMFAPGFVLTAAHCVMAAPGTRDCVPAGKGKCELDDPGDISITRPAMDGTPSGASAGATNVFAHPKFRYPTGAGDIGSLDADVAIIRMDRVLSDSPRDLINIAAPTFDRSFVSGGECARVAGWGRTDVISSNWKIISRGEETRKLQALNLELQSRARCSETYGEQVSDNMLCAGDGVEGFNTCSGDSGGPLILDVGGPIQVGIVSWAYGCAQKEHYTVFTRVGSPEVRGWINEVMGVDKDG